MTAPTPSAEHDDKIAESLRETARNWHLETVNLEPVIAVALFFRAQLSARGLCIAPTAGAKERTIGTRWRHLRTGHLVTIVGRCRLEATNEPAYLYDHDGVIWARSMDQFLDGRFEEIASIPAAPSPTPAREREVEAVARWSEDVHVASQAYAEATGYYGQFHRGLSSVSADKIRDDIAAALDALRTRPALAADPAKDLTRCPLNLEDNHWICSAGFCDVCQADLRMQCGRLRRLLNGRDSFIVENGLWEKFCACVADETNLSAGKTASPGTVGKEGPAQTGDELAGHEGALDQARYTIAIAAENEKECLREIDRLHTAHGEAVEALRLAREALTPSGATKAAYSGEFSFSIDDVDGDGYEWTRKIMVPWTTIKDIMKAISARAILANLDASQGAEGE